LFQELLCGVGAVTVHGIQSDGAMLFMQGQQPRVLAATHRHGGVVSIDPKPGLGAHEGDYRHLKPHLVYL
jgi:hypothetical protein